MWLLSKQPLNMCLDSVYRVTSCVWRLYICGTHCYSSFQLNVKTELKCVAFFFLQRTVLRVLPRTWLFMFLKPSKPIKIEDQNSETKTKTESTNLRLNQSNPCEKKKNQNRSTHQTHMKPKPNQTHQIHMKPKPNQTHQTDLPSKHKSNLSPISTSPSTTNFPYQTHQTHCQSTHQTHRRSTHPPPPSLGYFSFSFICVPVPNCHSFQFQGVLSWVGEEWNWERGWNGFIREEYTRGNRFSPMLD